MSDTLAPTQKLTRPPPASAQVEVRSTADHDALAPGTRLDEFEIVRVLGAGGFGIVYLAIDHVLQREVAIKEYMPGALAGRGEGAALVMRSPELGEAFALGLESFFNEARLLACFDHPSLVKVYRCWKAHGTAYMAMQYYPGVTLKQARRAMVAAPDEAWLRAFIEPLLDVLELLHGEGVFHRDIAPDNILLLPDGRPVLLDFGSARRVIGDATQSLTAVLKPNFAPIEQYADMAGMRQGPWTDIYALGATVHFMLTGGAPAPAVLRAVRDAAPALSAPDGAAFAGVPNRFLAVIDWSLALAPEDRPQSVGTFRQALDGRVVPPASSARQRFEPRRLRDDASDVHTVDSATVFDTVSAGPEAKIAPVSSSDTADAVPSRRRTARLTWGALALTGLALLAWSLKAPTAAVPTTAAETAVSTRPSTAASSPAPAVVSARRRALPGGGPSSPRAACADLNYFARSMCISRECQNPRWRAHPQCADARAMEEQRQRQADQY